MSDTNTAPRLVSVPPQHHVDTGFVEITDVQGDHETGTAAEIADAMINLIRTYGNMKSRATSSVDPEVASLFLLVRLVKDGPQRAKELADSMCADQSTVSRQVAGLVKAGYIERKADPDDGRASILVATTQGVERVHAHFIARGRALEPVTADWSDADRQTFVRLLRTYNASLAHLREDVLTTMGRSSAPHHASLQHAQPQHTALQHTANTTQAEHSTAISSSTVDSQPAGDHLHSRTERFN